MTPLDRVHPDVAAAFHRYPFGTADAAGLAERRRRMRVPRSRSDAVERTDHLVPGDPPVPVRVHRPVTASCALPCLYWMHGGGYIVGTYDLDDAVFDHHCPTQQLVGVSVDYRLAPETPYPGPLEDCYAGLRWTFEHADELGIDRSCIGIGGGSAGGGLAAALAILVRERGELELAFQLLECPMLDDREITPSSQQDGLPIWSRESNRFGWQSYLGDLYGTDDVPPTAAAARADDLSGLPPTFVSVGAVDGFVDEDVDYALRLNRAGVPVELHVYPGLPHGYQLAPRVEVVRRTFRDRDGWLRAQLQEKADTE